jgi:hypothetical protein
MTSRFASKLKHAANLATLDYNYCLPVFVCTSAILGGYTGLYFSFFSKDTNAKYAPLFVLGGFSTGAMAGIFYPVFIPWGMYKFSKEFIELYDDKEKKEGKDAKVPL